jgi:mono/diheme cytochrome c family protein
MAAMADHVLPKGRVIRIAWLTAFIFSIALLLLPFLIKLDGKTHADWQQFLGRFHPLAVHIPIGLIVLVPVLEIAGIFRPALREAAGFVLALSFFCCVGTLTLGFLLAYGSGETGVGVTRHMWGGITLTIGVLVCVLARPGWSSGPLSSSGIAPRVYPLILGFALLTLIYAAHQGGNLTHGSNYLSEYMPIALKRWVPLGIVEANAPIPGSFYAKQINPIFDRNCVTCHGEAKTKGGLRLDSYAQLMKGGKDGRVIVSGRPEQSLLLARVTLPPSHKEFMPAEGNPPLKPEEIAWLRAWVLDGASPTATHVVGISIHTESNDLPLQPVGDYSAMMPEIVQMAKGQGAKLIPVSSKASDGLILNTVDIASSFGDAQLVQFQKFAPYIVEVELGRTAVTNSSFDTLDRFTHLRAIHLEGTSVTGDGIQKLAPLSQLTYLNLSGSKLTATALPAIAAMKNLRHVYIYNTPAQPAPPAVAKQPIARNAQ